MVFFVLASLIYFAVAIGSAFVLFPRLMGEYYDHQ